MSARRNFIALPLCLGLLVASAVWAVNTELGQILPYLDCQQQVRFSAIGSFAGVVASCLAGLISWRVASHTRTLGHLTTLKFVGSVSALSALVFAFALSLQGIASLVLNGCER
jgi:predicted membrane-bound spermidine synthase